MDDGGIGIPTNIKNEWLILETCQQLMSDEKQAEEDRRAQFGEHADYQLPVQAKDRPRSGRIYYGESPRRSKIDCSLLFLTASRTPYYTAVVVFPSEAIQRCKQDLDKQIQLNLARSEEQKRDAEARKEQQRKLRAEHEAHQQELKESCRKKLLVSTHRSVRAQNTFMNHEQRPTRTQSVRGRCPQI